MTYIWHSGATDVTGKALAEQLHVDSGKTKPRNQAIVIGWGCKTDEEVTFPAGTHVLNHPNAIRKNRNKLGALDILKGDRVTTGAVAKYTTADRVTRELNAGNIKLPLIGRTRMHQGGKGFWFCPTQSAVDAATRDGANYFQEFIDINQEYRLHVFCGDVIYAQKKVENPSEDGWVAQRREKIQEYADKKGDRLDADTLVYALKRLAKEAVLPDRIVRSNKRGWKFSSVQPRNVDQNLRNVAIAAVAAIGLDFGAVDCAIDQNGNPWIIEVNSGPGLQGSSFEAYVSAFRAKIDELERPAPAPRARRAAAAPAAAPARGRGARARAAVGAAAAEEAQADAQVPEVGQGIARVMRNVQNDEEARAVIAALMRGDI